MKLTSKHLVATVASSILLLSGCDNIQDCDAARVKESVVNLAGDFLDKGLKPSEQDLLRKLRSTKIVLTQEKAKESGVRTCTAKLLITFNGPVSDLLTRMVEDGEKIADDWESVDKARLDDLRKRTLGIPPYSPLNVTAEIASRYADENMAFMKSSSELRRQIKSLRETWNNKEKGIDFVSDYRVSKQSSDGQFTVELSARESAPVRNAMSLVVRAQASSDRANTATGTNPSPDASSAKSAVALTLEMDYEKAREVLKKTGWTPARGDFEKLGVIGKSHYNGGFIEVESCADTGLAQCKFNWVHDTKNETLTVQTSGEDPKVKSWSIK